MSIRLENMHKDFLSGLKNGHGWQLFIGNQFLKEGFFVQVPSLKLRQKITDENIYTDSGDITIVINNKTYRFECKSLKIEFTSNADFPADKIIVDMVSNWDKKKHRPIGIINVCTKTKGKFVIFTRWGSHDEWIKKNIYDSKKDYHREFYFINKESRYVKSWDFLINWLRTLEVNNEYQTNSPR